MAREIFISYSRWNQKLVKEIKGEIEQATGAECWMDLNAIESGAAQFTQDIVDGINTCPVFLFMLSKESQASKFALRELNLASQKAEKNNQKHVVIVNIDGGEMCDEFLLLYGLSNIITWQDKSQKEKLLRDVKLWLGKVEVKQEEVEARRREEEDAKRSADAIIQRPPKKAFVWIPKMKRVWQSTSKPVRWGLGIVLISTICLSIYAYCSSIVFQYPFTEGLALVRNGFGNYGYIDESGEVVIPCQWKWGWSFSDGLARVQDANDKWGYIDKTGKVVIPCQWKDSGSFSEGLAIVQDADGKWWKIDKTGKVVGPM